MGLARAQMLDEWEQGWSFTSQHVCPSCVEDPALRSALQGATEADETCDFCGGAPAAPLDVLLDHFVRGLRTEYGDADNEGVYYDGREGGYQWHRTWDTPELNRNTKDPLRVDLPANCARREVWPHARVQPDAVSPVPG